MANPKPAAYAFRAPFRLHPKRPCSQRLLFAHTRPRGRERSTADLHTLVLLVGRAANGLPQCLPCDRSAPLGDVMESWLDPAWASSGQPCDVAASPGSRRPSRAWRGAERPPPGTRREARPRRRCSEPWPVYFRPGVPVPAAGRGPAAPDPISGGVDGVGSRHQEITKPDSAGSRLPASHFVNHVVL